MTPVLLEYCQNGLDNWIKEYNSRSGVDISIGAGVSACAVVGEAGDRAAVDLGEVVQDEAAMSRCPGTEPGGEAGAAAGMGGEVGGRRGSVALGVASSGVQGALLRRRAADEGSALRDPLARDAQSASNVDGVLAGNGGGDGSNLAGNIIDDVEVLGGSDGVLPLTRLGEVVGVSHCPNRK